MQQSQTIPIPQVDSSIEFSKIIKLLYMFSLILTSLSAYAIGPLPVPWLADIFILFGTLLIGIRIGLYPFDGHLFLSALIFWSIFITTFNSSTDDYAKFMPRTATTPYEIYISLRIVSLFSFCACISLVRWLLQKGNQRLVIRYTVIWGSFVSFFALYIYFAQIFGLPEPDRTRMSTAGGVQRVIFSGIFHRAMGTFREPSHLAQWLVIPFFLSLAQQEDRHSHFHIPLQGIVILLTGSLTGIMGISIGVLGAFFLFRSPGLRKLKILSPFVLYMALGIGVFSTVAYGYVSNANVSIIDIVVERITPISEGGMQESNRFYIYDFTNSTQFPIMGVGFGNSNILLSQYFHSSLIVSFLSLYFNLLYSVGIIGFILAMFFLLTPIAQILISGNTFFENERRVFWILSAYIAWLVMFSVHQEEFSIMFGIIFALLTFETSKSRSIT